MRQGSLSSWRPNQPKTMTLPSTNTTTTGTPMMTAASELMRQS